MRFDAVAVRELARRQGMSLAAALRRAGVSRNAFYTLSRRPSALPRSVVSLARALGVPATQLLREEAGAARSRAEALVREARRIRARRRRSSFENLWHTLNLLDMAPAERLARSLVRGRTRAVHR